MRLTVEIALLILHVSLISFVWSPRGSVLQYHTNKMRNTCKRGKYFICTCLIVFLAIFVPKSVMKYHTNEMTIRCKRGKATSTVPAFLLCYESWSLHLVLRVVCVVFWHFLSVCWLDNVHCMGNAQILASELSDRSCLIGLVALPAPPHPIPPPHLQLVA